MLSYLGGDGIIYHLETGWAINLASAALTPAWSFLKSGYWGRAAGILNRPCWPNYFIMILRNFVSYSAEQT
jgi:hypothetical protein